MCVKATDGPAGGSLHGIFLVRASVQQGCALIEGEHDVRSELVLNLHRDFRREPMGVPVDERLEGHAILVDVRETILRSSDDVGVGMSGLVHRDDLLEPHAEGHDLEPARVGERWTRPIHECREPSRSVDDVASGLKEQMVGVSEECLGAESGHRFGENSLDRRLRPDRDEGGRVNVPVRSGDDSRPAQRGAVASENAPVSKLVG